MSDDFERRVVDLETEVETLWKCVRLMSETIRRLTPLLASAPMTREEEERIEREIKKDLTD